MVDGNVFVVRIISPFNHKMAPPKQVAPYSAVSVSVPFLKMNGRVCNWVVMLIAVTVQSKLSGNANVIEKQLHCAHLFYVFS